MMKTIIFDMYGVILKDPEGNLMPFVNNAFPDLKYDDVYQHWKKASIGDLSSFDFLGALGFSGDLNQIERAYLDAIEINESFYQFVTDISKHYRLALLSNDLSEWSRYLREKFDLNHFFDLIIVSGDVKIKKPDPQIFRLILNELRQPASECIYIDDRRKNLDSAQSLGIEPILFNSRNVPYDGKIVRDFDELTKMLKNT